MNTIINRTLIAGSVAYMETRILARIDAVCVPDPLQLDTIGKFRDVALLTGTRAFQETFISQMPSVAFGWKRYVLVPAASEESIEQRRRRSAFFPILLRYLAYKRDAV